MTFSKSLPNMVMHLLYHTQKSEKKISNLKKCITIFPIETQVTMEPALWNSCYLFSQNDDFCSQTPSSMEKQKFQGASVFLDHSSWLPVV